MKGVYIARLDIDAPHLFGVGRKIRAQVKALESFFPDIDLYCISGNQMMHNGKVLKDFGGSTIKKRIGHYASFYLELAHTNLHADFAYIRYQRCCPIFLYLLMRFKSKYPKMPVLIEIPSYPYDLEYKSKRDRLLLYVDKATRWALRYFVDYVVTFSRESEIFGVRTICTDNGVDDECLMPLPPPSSFNPVHLVGLANLSYWHGYDRIISGLARYYAEQRERKVVFDVVGCGPELQRLKNAAVRAGLDNYVIFHGPLHGSQLRKVLEGCHVGVSSIALHRLGMDSSTLKSVEFCAYGIPFLMSRLDRGVPAGLPFVFYTQDDDEPIDIEALLTSYDNLKAARPDFSDEMRSYAECHLTWKAKMHPVVETICKHLDSNQ